MRKPRFAKRLARGAASTFFAAALAVSQCGVTAAWAAEGDWSYPVPTAPATIDKSLVTFGSQGDIWGEILGISDIARNMTSDFGTDGSPVWEGENGSGGVKNDIVVNLFGSDVNVNPNPYYTNLIYNAKAAEADRVDHYSFADKSGLGTGIDRADTVLVDAYGGVSATMSQRPDIVMGNCATGWQDPGAIRLRSDDSAVAVSNYKLAKSAGYDAQVETIRALDKSSEYYQEGDEDYNPYYVENLSMYGDVVRTGSIDAYFNNGRTHLTVGPATINSTYAQMYDLVEAIEGVMKDNPSLKTRYGNPADIAAQYESYGKGMQDYVLSQIAAGKETKKKVAVVSAANVDAKTVTLYRSAPSDTIQGTGGSFSGPYKHMEALENITDNIAGTWSTTGDNTSRTEVLTDISKLKDADAIILASSGTEPNFRAVVEAAGITEAQLPPLFVQYAESTARGIPGFPMLQTDGLEMEAEEIGFVYPETINPVHALAYYYTQFYHVKNDTTTLSNVLSYNIEKMSLPEGVTTDLTGYSDEAFEAKITEGLEYYAKNKYEIDSAHPKLTLTDHVTSVDSIAAAALTDQISDVDVTDEDAVDEVVNAYYNLTKSEQALVTGFDKLAVAGIDSTRQQLEQAESDLADAKDAATKAQNALATAQKNLATAKDEAAAANTAKEAAEKEAADAKQAAEEANTAKDTAEQAAKEANDAKAKAEQEAKDANAAKDKAEQDAKDANDAKERAEQAVKDAQGEAQTANGKVDTLQSQVDDLNATLAKMSVTSVTVNVKKVTASAISSAITKAGGDAKYVTKVVIGTKATKIAANSFKALKKVETAQVKSTKLKKAGVKNSLKGSAVELVKVPSKKLKAYKKIFTKKNCGKQVTVSK